MTHKECVKIAKKVMDHYQFNYFQNRGWAIINCANHMMKVIKDRPHLTEQHIKNHILYVAKHFYITEINKR